MMSSCQRDSKHTKDIQLAYFCLPVCHVNCTLINVITVVTGCAVGHLTRKCCVVGEKYIDRATEVRLTYQRSLSKEQF